MSLDFAALETKLAQAGIPLAEGLAEKLVDITMDWLTAQCVAQAAASTGYAIGAALVPTLKLALDTGMHQVMPGAAQL